jgi:hypothetical protein
MIISQCNYAVDGFRGIELMFAKSEFKNSRSHNWYATGKSSDTKVYKVFFLVQVSFHVIFFSLCDINSGAMLEIDMNL